MLCTKPVGAKSLDGMYNWTREILEDQVAIALRRARTRAPTDAHGAPIADGQSGKAHAAAARSTERGSIAQGS